MPDFKKIIGKELDSFLQKKNIQMDTSQIIEIPPDPKMGDFALPCFRLAKEMKKSPQEIARELAANLKMPKEIEKIDVAGGYLNFYTSKNSVAQDIIPRILKEKEKFGRKSGGKITTMVEYIAPNTNKPLHIGHLRNAALGMSIIKILGASGRKVIKANMVNDRGIHICKSMLAYKKFGNAETPESAGIKGDHLVGKYYVMFEQKLKDDPKSADELRDMLQKWEDNDKETIALWKKMNDWVLRGFDVTYARFGSEFDVTFLESAIYKKAGGIVEEGLKKGVFGRDENGAIVARLKKYGLPDKVVLRADGTSIYATNDLALTKQKFEKFHLDENVWVVASEQNLYFKQLFKIFELLGYKWAKNCHHLSYGMVFLPEGRLKSREGKIIDADDLMDDMQKSAADEIKKRSPEISEKELNCRAKEIALCAIKFFMLKTDSGKDITFDVKSSLSFEGESGPYLQYTYARAKSILRKARIPEKADFSMLNSEIEKELVMLLARYESAVDKSLEQYSPHVLCQYLLKLAETFNTFYHNTPVLKAEKAKMDARILLVAGVAQTLKNGLELLDISTVEEM